MENRPWIPTREFEWWPEQKKKQHIETKEERKERWDGMEMWRLPNDLFTELTKRRQELSMLKLRVAYKEQKLKDSYYLALKLLHGGEYGRTES